MAKLRPWLAILFIIGACVCGARTECSKRAQISFLTSIHDDPSCRKLSSKGVLMYEAAKFLVDAHNNKSDVYELELSVLDTCGSITGALKAAMKALVTADMNCLQPPHYLGIIGPDTMTNAEVVHKITSVLRVPHIVKRSSMSPYLHHLAQESDAYLVEAALKVMEALNWKSFTLVVNTDEEENDDDDDDVQHMARSLTMNAIAKGLCVMIHEHGEEDYTSHIVHIGKPEDEFFGWPVNATILIVSEGNLEGHLNRINTTNTVLLLEDSRNEFAGLEERVEQSSWWTAGQGARKYDSEELRDVRWLEDAIKTYAKALDMVCKKKRCRNQINPVDWNSFLEKVLENENVEARSTPRTLDLTMKLKDEKLQIVGNVIHLDSKATIRWIKWTNEDNYSGDSAKLEHESDDHQSVEDDDEAPEIFKRILSSGIEPRTGCATTVKEIKMLHEEDDEAARVLVSVMDDVEWWTMVGTVGGAGIAMFAVGILAVYILYTNIRGRSPKKSQDRSISRDSSLRRVESDRELPTMANGRHQKQGGRHNQRRDSNRSIRSNMSDKSV